MNPARSPERVERTWVLLRSFADWEPSVKTWTGSVVARAGAQGEVGVQREPCEPCDGTGRLKSGTACRQCRGRGYRTVDPQTRREAPEAPDPDDFQVSPRELALAVRYRRVRCDRCAGRPHPEHGCPACASTGFVDALDTRQTDASLRRLERDWGGLLGTGLQDPGWWLPAALERKQRQWTTGSYPELEQLLARLELEWPGSAAALDRWVIRPALDSSTLDPSEAMRDHLDKLVGWLAERMPWPIRVPTRGERDWARRDVKHDLWRSRDAGGARAQRDMEIARLVAGGEAVASVAAAFALTPKRVRQIVQSSAGVATVAA